MANPPGAAAASAAKAIAKSAVDFTAGRASFSPRKVFDVSPSITRSYFLGHHKSALNKMRQVISNVGLIIECRDFRIPITSWNPVLERALSERPRIIVYTHRDLVGPFPDPPRHRRQAKPEPLSTEQYLIADLVGYSREISLRTISTLRDYHAKHPATKAVLFTGNNAHSQRELISSIKAYARELDSLTGLRCMVVGMPNAGKSTLLNNMRMSGMNLPKCAKTSGLPGATRKIGSPVRIAPGESTGRSDARGLGEGVYVLDTPGVFVPYVSKAEDMLKLALVGTVKDGLVPAITLVDYLLYHMNLVSPKIYTRWCNGTPTNDVHEFLAGVAARTGKLAKGGEPNLDAAALWVVQEWRRGGFGNFILDVVTPESLAEAVRSAENPELSMNQAKKLEKELRKARSEMKRMGISPAAAGQESTA